MIELDFPNFPRVVPHWAKWDSHRKQRCRCCGLEIERGWHAIGVSVPDPYLCGQCWATGGGCLELR